MNTDRYIAIVHSLILVQIIYAATTYKYNYCFPYIIVIISIQILYSCANLAVDPDYHSAHTTARIKYMQLTLKCPALIIIRICMQVCKIGCFLVENVQSQLASIASRRQ